MDRDCSVIENAPYEDVMPREAAHEAAQVPDPCSTPIPVKDCTLKPMKPDAFVKYLAYEAIRF